MRQLSIIILHHNTPHDAEKCLESLQSAILPENTEIAVINNGGHASNKKINPKLYKTLKTIFLDIPNKGYAQGNNAGLKITEAQYYLFMNADIVVQKNTIDILLKYMKQYKHAGIVAPQLIYPDGTVQDNFRVFPRFFDLIIKRTPLLRRLMPERMREYLMWDKEPNVNESVDWVTGACMMVEKSCLEAVGNHDERLFLFMSDLVMCRRAWEKGFEVHFVGSAKAHHNEKRLSSGGFWDIFSNKSLRIHIKDAFRYYLIFLFRPLPKLSPSLKFIRQKDRLLKASELSRKSLLLGVTNRLQRHNPVVTVYSGQVAGYKNYEQPVIFFNTGVIAVITNANGHIGLIEMWRHVPLNFHKKNTFPIFPDVNYLGVWSLECPRGGIEKTDSTPEYAIKRELNEEIGLRDIDISSITSTGRIIGNTAIDVYSHLCFHVTVKDSFVFKSNEKMETIRSFQFFTQFELDKLVSENRLFCGLTQAAIMQNTNY